MVLSETSTHVQMNALHWLRTWLSGCLCHSSLKPWLLSADESARKCHSPITSFTTRLSESFGKRRPAPPPSASTRHEHASSTRVAMSSAPRSRDVCVLSQCSTVGTSSYFRNYARHSPPANLPRTITKKHDVVTPELRV